MQRTSQHKQRPYSRRATWRIAAVSTAVACAGWTWGARADTPADLIWAVPGGTWDTLSSDLPWIDAVTSAPAPFAAGDDVQFTDAGVGVVNVAGGGVSPDSMSVANAAGTYTFNGGGIFGGPLTKGGAGAAVLANAANTFGDFTVNGGTVTVGGADGATSSLTVGGTLNVANGASVTLLPATSGTALLSGVTHSIGAINLNTSGTFDVGNGSVLIGTSDAIRTSVASAAGKPLASPPYGSGLNTWTGTGLTSSVVRADAANANAKQLALGYFDSRDNGQTGLNVPAGQTLVKPTVYGDATGDGKVNIADLSVWNNNFGVASPRWSQGDFNYDGKVNIPDLSIWYYDFSGNLDRTGGSAAAPAAAKATSVPMRSTLSGRPAVTQGTSVVAAPAPFSAGALTLEVEYGDAFLYSGGVTIAAYEIDSASGDLVSGNWKSLKNYYGYTQWAFPPSSRSSTDLCEFISDPTPAGQPVTLAAGTVIDLGHILPPDTYGIAGASGDFQLPDITFSYNVVTDPVNGFTQTVTVPEPSGLLLTACAGVALLGRTRRVRSVHADRHPE